LLKFEIKAAAAGKLNDPNDAFQFLNLNDFQVNENGDFDSKEVNKAIDNLLKDKPYLASHKTIVDVDGGARGKPTSSKENMNDFIRQAFGR
jgi:hypothetical protein